VNPLSVMERVQWRSMQGLFFNSLRREVNSECGVTIKKSNRTSSFFTPFSSGERLVRVVYTVFA
jgi:hypothetical protein